MSRRRIIHLFFGAVFIGVFIFLNSQIFLLKTIHYYGSVFTSKTILDTVTKSYMNRSLLYARFRFPFLFLDQIPTLSRVNFNIKWPNTLEVTLDEKKPWLTFLIDNNTIIISRDGTIMNKGVESIENMDQLTIIRGIDSSYFQSDSLRLETLEDMVVLIDTFSSVLPDLEYQVEKSMNNHWILLKDDVLPIYLGYLDHLEDKSKLLKAFLRDYSNQIRKKSINYIDLRVHSKCIVNYE